ncbi:MAG: nucleoside hydrolase [Sporolactobacillus sp.]
MLSGQPRKKTLLIDCDPGIDDAIMLMIAFIWQEQLEIKGITCVSGNQTAARTFMNARRIASHFGKILPIARGAVKPLIKPPIYSEEVNGKTGLEGMQVTTSCIPADPRSAFDLICEVLSETDSKITWIATAPLTNLAHVLSVRPQLKEKIDHITLMGGSSGRGNMTNTAEFNIFVDPEAAKIVFDSGIPIVMFGLDVTLKAYSTREDIEEIVRLGNKASRLLGDVLHYYLPFSEKSGLSGAPIHDACTMIYELKPELFSGIKQVSVDVDTSGGVDYGRTIIDFAHRSSSANNVSFVTDVDRKAFNHFLYQCCARFESQ